MSSPRVTAVVLLSLTAGGCADIRIGSPESLWLL